jgi:hypothetical protein
VLLDPDPDEVRVLRSELVSGGVVEIDEPKQPFVDEAVIAAEFTIAPAMLAKLNAAMGYDGKAVSSIQSW